MGVKMTKEKLALEVIERLKKEYPDADCTLDYNQAWKLHNGRLSKHIAHNKTCVSNSEEGGRAGL